MVVWCWSTMVEIIRSPTKQTRVFGSPSSWTKNLRDWLESATMKMYLLLKMGIFQCHVLKNKKIAGPKTYESNSTSGNKDETQLLIKAGYSYF